MTDGLPIPRDALRRPFIESRIADAVFIVDPLGQELAHEGSLQSPRADALAPVIASARTHGASTSERLDDGKPQVVACIAVNDLRGGLLGAACGSINLAGRRAADFFALLRQYPNVPAVLTDRSGRLLVGPPGATAPPVSQITTRSRCATHRGSWCSRRMAARVRPRRSRWRR